MEMEGMAYTCNQICNTLRMSEGRSRLKWRLIRWNQNNYQCSVVLVGMVFVLVSLLQKCLGGGRERLDTEGKLFMMPNSYY